MLGMFSNTVSLSLPTSTNQEQMKNMKSVLSVLEFLKNTGISLFYFSPSGSDTLVMLQGDFLCVYFRQNKRFGGPAVITFKNHLAQCSSTHWNELCVMIKYNWYLQLVFPSPPGQSSIFYLIYILYIWSYTSDLLGWVKLNGDN